ncbi:formyltransferase family protein [Helicobacter sp. 23-1044]
MKTINLAILFSGNGSNLENIYKKMQGLICNSSLGNHCVDLQNFGASQTASLVSAPKFCKNSTSTTAIRRICERSEATNTRIDSKENAESDELCHIERSEISQKKRDSSLVSLDQNDKTIAESKPNCAQDSALQLNFSLAISSNKSAFGITRCKNLGLKCEVIDYKANKGDFFEKIIATLESHNINLVILAGFMKILPPKFTAKFRAINIHPSILPLFKGAHAIAESYQSDMKIAGVSVHFVNDELDGGALIAQDIIQKIDGESFESFEARIHALEHELYPKAIIKALQTLQTLGF